MIPARILPSFPNFYTRHPRVVDVPTDLPRLSLLLACILVRFGLLATLVFQALALLFLSRLLIVMAYCDGRGDCCS